MYKKFLIRYVNTYINFRLCELNSLVSLFNIGNLNYIDTNLSYPFLILETDDEINLAKCIQRSVLARELFELVDYANSIEELKNNLKNDFLQNKFFKFENDSTFKIQVESFNRRLTLQEKHDLIEQFSFLFMNGKVDLTNAKNNFYLILNYDLDENGFTSSLIKVYFLRFICERNRQMINELSLSKRNFISNTSMDVTLSLLMANLAKVKENDLVLDLYVGSGSLLISSAKYGAYVLGCDIDYLLLHGLSKPSKKGCSKRENDECIKKNFKQYNLESKYIDIIVSDSSLPLWKYGLKFDSIITDPPYGIRESAIKIGSKEPVKEIPEDCLDKHYPKKVEYNLHDLLKDLFDFCSHHLILNGRLVFWLPFKKDNYNSNDLPKHSCFNLISFTEQYISGKYCRVLICLEKVQEPLGEMVYIPESTKTFRKDFHKKNKT